MADITQWITSQAKKLRDKLNTRPLDVVSNNPAVLNSARARATLPQTQQYIQQANTANAQQYEAPIRMFTPKKYEPAAINRTLNVIPENIRLAGQVAPSYINLPQVKNPVGNFALRVAEDQLRAPLRVGGGLLSTLGNVTDASMGRKVAPTKAIADAATLVEGGIDLASFAFGGGLLKSGAKTALKQGGKQAFKQGFKQAAKQGALYGATFGGLRGLQDYNAEDVTDQFLGAIKETAIGGVAGLLLGPGAYTLGRIGGKGTNFIKKELKDSFRFIRDETGKITAQPRRIYNTKSGKPGQFRNDKYQRGAIDFGEGLEGLKETGRQLKSLVTGKGGSSKPVPQKQPPSGALPPTAGQKLSVLKSSAPPSPRLSLTSGSQPNLRGFSESMQDAPNISGKTKDLLPPSQYTPKTNSKLMGEAEALLQKDAKINLSGVEGVDQKIAATMQEAINLDKAGNHEAAANLFNNLAEYGTELGRGVQAFSLLKEMSPKAIALSVAGKINRYNKTALRQIPKLQGEQLAAISRQVDKINSVTGREKELALYEMENLLNSFIPSGIADKAIILWKAGLLTSLRTHERNLIGNTIMSAGEVAKDVPAAIADAGMALITGKRSMTATLRGTKTGLKGTGQQVKDIVTKGFDSGGQTGKYEVRKVNWGESRVGKALKAYTDTVFNTLSAEDKPFYNSAFGRSIADQAKTIARNTGESAEKLIKSPTPEMVTTAAEEAAYATFHDKNILTRVAQGIKKIAANPRTYGDTRFSGMAAEAGKAVTEFTMPFTGVPGSIAGKTIAYSPLGLIKGVTKAGFVAAGKVPELQRQAAQEIGRGVLGTSLMGIGAYLFQKGLMTGQPKDATEARQWQLENKQANSVMFNGKWRSINSVGPQTLVVLAGAKAAEELGDPEGSVGALAGGLTKDQLEQTFMQGAFKPLQAINDPARYGQSYTGSTLSSVVPNIVKDTSKAFDPNMREYNSATDYVKASIPGVRNTMFPSRDVLGNIRTQEPSGWRAYVDLFNSKEPVDNTVVNELARLNVVGESATPSKISKSQTILGEKIELTPKELDKLEEQSGGAITKSLQQLISSSDYNSLEDDEKAKLIKDTVSDIRKSTKLTLASGGEVKDEEGVIRTISDGQLVTINYGKVTSMPDGSRYEKALKEEEAWKVASQLYETNIPDEQKQAVYQQLGIDPAEVQYYSVAKRDNDIKGEYVAGVLEQSTTETMMDDLVMMRKKVNGEYILADGVIDDLYNAGVITSAQKKYLKDIDDIDLKSGSTKIKASKAKKAKKLKAAPKISLPKITVPKVKAAKAKKIKVKKPKISVPKIPKRQKISTLTSRKVTIKPVKLK